MIIEDKDIEEAKERLNKLITFIEDMRVSLDGENKIYALCTYWAISRYFDDGIMKDTIQEMKKLLKE
jgi:flagellin-specific chaperone FliS